MRKGVGDFTTNTPADWAKHIRDLEVVPIDWRYRIQQMFRRNAIEEAH